jgi:cysteine sulfinate desulfinase/cysteine desulfurase-like protein
VKSALESRGVIIGPGPTCDGQIAALGLPAILVRGVLRVSFSDDSTENDVKLFMKALRDVFKKSEYIARRR